MKVSRNFSLKVQYALDEWVPPRLRDSRWLMYAPMKAVLKDSTGDFMSFKDWIFDSSEQRFADLYARTEKVQSLQGDTDLNEACLEHICRTVRDQHVLEVGCGRGLLAQRLSQANTVTACDIAIGEDLRTRFPAVNFMPANTESLPFADATFDVVVATHTLEHVIDLRRAMAELRRVAKSEIIVVVPRQRPYRYTFSLHTQFFPYDWSLRAALGPASGPTEIIRLGDWFYRERVA